jgi:hypothetical protein
MAIPNYGRIPDLSIASMPRQHNQFRIETPKTRYPAEETLASTGSIQSSPAWQRAKTCLPFSPSLFLSFSLSLFWCFRHSCGHR